MVQYKKLKTFNIMTKLSLIFAILVLAVGAAVFFWPRRTAREQGAAPVTPAPVSATPKAQKHYSTFPGVLTAADRTNKKVRITTVKGDIVLSVFGDEAPKAASNFLTLARDGFYDGLTFHRRVEGFVIQGGDPSGNGSGGPGYQFEDEPVKRKYNRGILAMANAGPNTNGSQFFIMLADYPLPPSYTIFGEVVSGLEVVDQIVVGDVMKKMSIE